MWGLGDAFQGLQQGLGDALQKAAADVTRTVEDRLGIDTPGNSILQAWMRQLGGALHSRALWRATKWERAFLPAL
jgi:hypothetical protein